MCTVRLHATVTQVTVLTPEFNSQRVALRRDRVLNWVFSMACLRRLMGDGVCAGIAWLERSVWYHRPCRLAWETPWNIWFWLLGFALMCMVVCMECRGWHSVLSMLTEQGGSTGLGTRSSAPHTTRSILLRYFQRSWLLLSWVPWQH